MTVRITSENNETEEREKFDYALYEKELLEVLDSIITSDKKPEDENKCQGLKRRRMRLDSISEDLQEEAEEAEEQSHLLKKSKVSWGDENQNVELQRKENKGEERVLIEITNRDVKIHNGFLSKQTTPHTKIGLHQLFSECKDSKRSLRTLGAILP
mgnify:FL=1